MTWMRGWFSRWWAGARPKRSARADLRGLLSLDDRILADIGLRRAEVAAVANGPVPLGQLTGHGPISPSDVWVRPDEPAVAADRRQAEAWHAAA